MADVGTVPFPRRTVSRGSGSASPFRPRMQDTESRRKMSTNLRVLHGNVSLDTGGRVARIRMSYIYTRLAVRLFPRVPSECRGEEKIVPLLLSIQHYLQFQLFPRQLSSKSVFVRIDTCRVPSQSLLDKHSNTATPSSILARLNYTHTHPHTPSS
jgi:hypothetical protein